MFGIRGKKQDTKPVKKAQTFRNLVTGSNVATFTSIANNKVLANLATSNPVLFATLAIKANAMSNGKVYLKSIKDGTIIKPGDPMKGVKDSVIVEKAFRLFSQPNVLQSRREFLLMNSFFKDTFGNSFIFANDSKEKADIATTQSLWSVYPQYMGVKYANNFKYFEATEKSDIIDKWVFESTLLKKEFKPDEILHRKDVNLKFDKTNDILFGRSKIEALTKPLENINLAYESENVVLKNRGFRLMISMKQTPAEVGGLPMDEGDEKELQDAYGEYGLQEDQLQAFITRMPVDVQVIDQDVRKLGIHESIASNTMIVEHVFGVPEILIKLWIEGTTFENQSASVKRLYQGTVIPEFRDYVNDLSNFLQLDKYGYTYVVSFDDVPELQEDKKEQAQANNLISKTYDALFKSGGCTMNTWLRAIGAPELPNGDRLITEFPPEDQALFLGNIPTISTNESTGNIT